MFSNTVLIFLSGFQLALFGYKGSAGCSLCKPRAFHAFAFPRRVETGERVGASVRGTLRGALVGPRPFAVGRDTFALHVLFSPHGGKKRAMSPKRSRKRSRKRSEKQKRKRSQSKYRANPVEEIYTYDVKELCKQWDDWFEAFSRDAKPFEVVTTFELPLVLLESVDYNTDLIYLRNQPITDQLEFLKDNGFFTENVDRVDSDFEKFLKPSGSKRQRQMYNLFIFLGWIHFDKGGPKWTLRYPGVENETAQNFVSFLNETFLKISNEIRNRIERLRKN